jgi:apolipoprotein N-acyltransferase
MKSIFTRSTPLVLLSSVLCAIGVMYVQFYLAWVALIPFFIVLVNRQPKSAFGVGAAFGLGFSALMLNWMVGLIGDFAGKSVYGIVFFGIAMLMSMAYFGLMAMSISAITSGKKPVWLKGLLTAAVWTLGEWIYSSALPGMPWFGLYRVSNMVLDNLYAIQIASIGGAFIISFFVVLVNYLAAHYIACKQWKFIALPVCIAAAYMLAGYLMLQQFDQNYPHKDKPVIVAILCDNTSPDVKWDEANASGLVHKLLDLNTTALASHPDIALWSESVVPWTYRADDDFVKEVLKATAKDSVTHIIGMTTDYEPTEIYNSAYAILPGGKITGRYDKQFPVSLAETPMAFLSLPFGGSTDRPYERPGESFVPLPTPQGKAGVLICNDGTVPGATVKTVKEGAEFLVSLSNDAWFSEVKFLVKQHFYNTRLRAVEVRKDLAINCNMGSSGLVSASGRLNAGPADAVNTVRKVDLYSNKKLTFYTSFPAMLIHISTLFILIFIAINIFSRKKAKPI